ncbi:MAG: phosphoribosylformylglycinamidine synthase subunit PurL [Dehalococcoidia bacterium]|nr:phosphoribosylformylglycinamidine synthase subunit PurL [Dehalococcoidia bacterium]MSQ17652.1 phosphoribosylformylglycinamidine synthase subunit PurL [Dehalococcoidia bacterium]
MTLHPKSSSSNSDSQAWPSQAVLDEIALSRAEYEMILDRLDREPNPLELGMFGALWSEHCGYKHSRPLLRLFPGRSSRVLSKAGAENAGAIDIGDGLALVFKVESHNHPSAVEPLQGAATGVGGIVRDILAMGARPIALLNSLRFGPLDDPLNRHLFHGVVEGISWYGNCIGVPDVAGEIYFDPAYSQNPLVNAMCVGLAPIDRLATAAARTPGNVLLLVGAETGRDGIHGASGLASRTFESEEERRPTVQVGNPFMEKILIEACLEALATGAVEAIQDLGAAGLTSSTLESAAKGGCGVELDLSQVHRREPGMTPYEVMLSESQERMVLMVPPENVPTVEAVFRKWDIPCREIGRVIAQPEAHVRDGNRTVARLPLRHLVEAPRYRLQGQMSAEQRERQRLSLADVPLPRAGPSEVLLKLLASPNVASKQAVYRQYDHQVQTNTVVAPGSDAAVLRIKGTGRAIALCIDGNGRYCYLDPYRGGQMVVAEVCRNLSCAGAEPLALTDCLNFGNPQRPDIYYQLEWCIRGMARACRALGVPVVSGNVSLYNESRGQAIYPTPVVGGVGLLEDATRHARSAFPEAGLLVVMLGGATSLPPLRKGGSGGISPATKGFESAWRVRASDLAGSEYLQVVHGRVAGRPAIDLSMEKRVQALTRQAIRGGLAASAHDCSDGGLAVALAESCIQGGVGLQGGEVFARLPRRWDAALFGEAQSRVVLSLKPEHLPQLARLADEANVPLRELGRTGRARLKLGRRLDLPLTEIAAAWQGGLERALGKDTGKGSS